MTNKNYNLDRRKLFLPEYGRHIQNMVEYLTTIPDRYERTRQASVVIEIMENMNPSVSEAIDFKHKLWDHLFIMSDFRLDVDAPFPPPSPELFSQRPEKPAYPSKNLRLKHYGRNIKNIIESVATIKNEEDKAVISEFIARYMKNKAEEFNNENPSLDVIIDDIRQLSGNTLTLDESAFGPNRPEAKQAYQKLKKRNGSNNNMPQKKFQKNGQRQQQQQPANRKNRK